jgi:hypothetical protein
VVDDDEKTLRERVTLAHEEWSRTIRPTMRSSSGR